MIKTINKLKQTAFDLDLRQRNPVVHEHSADFTAMEIGAMAGDECRVLRCPACRRACIAQTRVKGVRFVHNAVIQSTTRRVKFEPVVYCDVGHEDLKVMRDQGTLIANRMGQILEVL